MSANLTKKFGPPPPPVADAVVLGVHFVVCVLILAVMKPPFVLEGNEQTSPWRLLFIAMVATSACATVAYYNVPPVHIFRRLFAAATAM